MVIPRVQPSLVTEPSLIADLVRETTCVSFKNLLDITFASDCALTVSAEFMMTKPYIRHCAVI